MLTMEGGLTLSSEYVVVKFLGLLSTSCDAHVHPRGRFGIGRWPCNLHVTFDLEPLEHQMRFHHLGVVFPSHHTSANMTPLKGRKFNTNMDECECSVGGGGGD